MIVQLQPVHLSVLDDSFSMGDRRQRAVDSTLRHSELRWTSRPYNYDVGPSRC